MWACRHLEDELAGAVIILFGSYAKAEDTFESDIDLAVRGCPRGAFFTLLGKLLVELEHPVDLVDLDKEPRLADFLEQEAQLVHVG